MDIYDVDHFIDVLKDDISIVKDLPADFSWSTRDYYAIAIRATRIKTAPVHASANWYLENVSPVLERLVYLLVFFPNQFVLDFNTSLKQHNYILHIVYICLFHMSDA